MDEVFSSMLSCYTMIKCAAQGGLRKTAIAMRPSMLAKIFYTPLPLLRWSTAPIRGAFSLLRKAPVNKALRVATSPIWVPAWLVRKALRGNFRYRRALKAFKKYNKQQLDRALAQGFKSV